MTEEYNYPGEAPKKNNTTLIVIIIVVIVLLCCCCCALGLAWNYGDLILEELDLARILPQLF